MTDRPGAKADHDAVWWLGSLLRVKGRGDKTGGAIGLSEVSYYAGFATPLHTHHREDEAWYVLEGAIRFLIGDQETTAEAGDFVFGPRDVPHSFKALETGARALVLTTPGGLEQMFLEGGLPVLDPSQPPPQGFDIERVSVLAKKYGCDVIGPPLA